MPNKIFERQRLEAQTLDQETIQAHGKTNPIDKPKKCRKSKDLPINAPPSEVAQIPSEDTTRRVAKLGKDDNYFGSAD